MSGRRGVHHSGGLRAKRRWLAWRRYQARSDAMNGRGPGGTWIFSHRGYVMAGQRWAYVGRYPPIGIRDVRP